MKILRISGRNLASLAGDFSLDFENGPLADAGLFAISGPTGAGKSTLLDALSLALYDRTPRLETRSSDVLRHPIGRTMIEQSVTKIFLANPEAVREEYVDGFGLTQAEFDIVRSLGAQGGRRFLVKQGHASAICELDLAGLEDFITVLSATTDNVALLDAVRERHGNDPFQWLPVLLRAVQDRRFRTSRRAA